MKYFLLRRHEVFKPQAPLRFATRGKFFYYLPQGHNQNSLPAFVGVGAVDEIRTPFSRQTCLT